MPNTPFSSQFLPIDYLLSAQTDIKAGKPVAGEALLGAIEQRIQQQLAGLPSRHRSSGSHPGGENSR